MREKRGEPFFLAIGFMNPHLPFVAPKKYWDMYDPASIELAKNPNPPKGAPQYAATSWGELRRYAEMPEKGPLSEEQARTAIHGYWAATSYVDAQVGRLLDELERLNLRERTIVILWGDHGWQLGEHGFWCKHTNYEVAARAPLIVSIPGQKTAGAKCERLVEFVDVLPTLAEAAGIPVPAEAEGTSLVPLTENPARAWKKAAFHLYPRSIPGEGAGMGRAIRTERYRLVEWTPNKPGSEFREYELYDYEADPLESRNLAESAEHAAVRATLIEQLHAGSKAAKPPAN